MLPAVYLSMSEIFFQQFMQSLGELVVFHTPSWAYHFTGWCLCHEAFYSYAVRHRVDCTHTQFKVFFQTVGM